MDWVAESVSKDTYVHIMEQYRPEFTVGKGEKRARSGFTKYEEIDRPVNDTEMQIVQVSGETDTLKKHRNQSLSLTRLKSALRARPRCARMESQ